MARQFDRKLVTEDGNEYYGYGFGASCDRAGELVFDTSMFGYQNLLHTPAYAGQLVVMSYPLTGNYGVADGDTAVDTASLGALIVREYNPEPSNWSAARPFAEEMAQAGVPGIEGLDTRALTRRLRDGGFLRGILTDADTDKEAALSLIRDVKSATPAEVSCRNRWYYRTAGSARTVVAVDSGITAAEITLLGQHGFHVTVVPWNTTAAEIQSLHPAGVYLSGGPGDPAQDEQLVALAGALRGRVPLAGNGLGCEAIGLCYGGQTAPLAAGHRGANLPVRRADGGIDITAQHHAFTLTAESLAKTPLTVTHVNLMDGTPEAIRCDADRVVATMFVPESASATEPEPDYLFDTFAQFIKEVAHHA